MWIKLLESLLIVSQENLPEKLKHLALQNEIKYTYDHPPTYDDEDGIRLRRTFGIFQKPARIRILKTGSTLFQNFAPEMITSINDGKICAYYG